MQSNPETTSPLNRAWTFLRHPRLRTCLFWIALLWMIGSSIHSSTWSSLEMRARVTTPDGKPIEGAIVVANWPLRHWLHGSTVGELAVFEAVTDARGMFRIPAWGPRYAWEGSIEIEAPTVHIFHRQFVPLILNNFDGPGMRSAPSVIKFRYQDQDIVLQPFVGTLLEYEKASHYFFFTLFFIDEGWQKCYWAALPNILIAMQRLNDDLEKIGADHGKLSYYKDAKANPELCSEERKNFPWSRYE